MFSISPQPEQVAVYRASDLDYAVARREAARQLFFQVRRRATFNYLWAWIRRRSSALPALEELYPGAHPVAHRPKGVESVHIASIVASEGRSGDFDTEFAPLSDHISERWQSIAMAWMASQPLPPVHLIAVGEHYVVRDGHHRISVAWALGAELIDAVVERWEAPPAPVAELAGDCVAVRL